MCPVCEQPLYNSESLQRHHITPIHMQGEDKFNNIVIVHTHCHQHIHYGGDLQRWITDLKIYKLARSTKILTSPFKDSHNI